MPANACQDTADHPGLPRLLSAAFYAASSFLITVVNKTVLTSFRWVALVPMAPYARAHEEASR